MPNLFFSRVEIMYFHHLIIIPKYFPLDEEKIEDIIHNIISRCYPLYDSVSFHAFLNLRSAERFLKRVVNEYKWLYSRLKDKTVGEILGEEIEKALDFDRLYALHWAIPRAARGEYVWQYDENAGEPTPLDAGSVEIFLKEKKLEDYKYMIVSLHG